MTAASPAESTLKERIRAVALELGFVRVGFTPATRLPEDAARLDAWRAGGRAGDMDYLADPPTRDDPEQILEGARTVIVVALPHVASPPPADAHTGRVARYALGRDYHVVMKERLRELGTRIEQLAGHEVRCRPCVDTAPLLEHAYAARAGVGFVGHHTLTIAPGVGSYFLLGELLTELELEPDAPLATRCGTCRRCLDVCPTGAFEGPFVLDARRCISYLTIEHRGAIPLALRPLLGTWVFGCDHCQEVCPYNATAAMPAPDRGLVPKLGVLDLIRLLELRSKGFRRFVRGTALARVSRVRLARNAAVALGNAADPRAIPALERASREDASRLVRDHAAWALQRLTATPARVRLPLVP